MDRFSKVVRGYIAPVFIVAVHVFLTGSASAQTVFSQINCSAPTDVPYVRDSREQVADVTNRTNYADALTEDSRLFMNKHIAEVVVNFTRFSTIWPDRLSVQDLVLSGEPWLGGGDG